MRWVRVLTPHIISALAVLGIALRANSRYEWESLWVFYLMALPLLYVVFRVISRGRLTETRARLNVRTVGSVLNNVIVESPFALRTFALGVLIIAIARPQTSDSVEDLTSEGIDMVIAMDVSVSMLSQDFSPNRLEESKAVAVEFIDSRPHDRIGIVAYEAEAYTQVPVTTDHVVVKNGINSLQTGLLEGGTAIGMGLATSVNRLRNSEAKSRVIILLTDGMNNAGNIDPLNAAQLAELNDIRIYTIGVGSIGRAYSPAYLRGDEIIFDWVDVKIDEDILMNIADRTGGKYFRATNAEKLGDIYEEIDVLEKTRFNVLRYQRKTEAYIGFLLIALGALLLEKVLSFTLIKSIS